MTSKTFTDKNLQKKSWGEKKSSVNTSNLTFFFWKKKKQHCCFVLNIGLSPMKHCSIQGQFFHIFSAQSIKTANCDELSSNSPTLSSVITADIQTSPNPALFSVWPQTSGLQTVSRTHSDGLSNNSFHFKRYATSCLPPATQDSVPISPLSSCPSGLETAQIPVRPVLITIGFKRLWRWDSSDLVDSHSVPSGQPVLIGWIEDFQSIQVIHTHFRAGLQLSFNKLDSCSYWGN